MAKRRNRRPSKNKITGLPKAAQIVGFSETEEAFFQAGTEQESAGAFVESTNVHEQPRPSFWRRLFTRAAA